MAGVMCIQVLIKENLVYQVSLTERKDKKCIYENIQLNINQNLIRNNIIYTSYKSIRNSVACLVIIFILAIFPYPNSGGSVGTGENDYKNMEIVYDTSAVKWLTENDQKDFPVNVFVEKYKLNGDTDIRNIYSKEMKLLVTIELSGERYIVRDIKGDVEEIDK